MARSPKVKEVLKQGQRVQEPQSQTYDAGSRAAEELQGHYQKTYHMPLPQTPKQAPIRANVKGRETKAVH